VIARPEAAGMSTERLERLSRHLEHRYIQSGLLPGCQLLIWRRDQLAYFRSFGLADRERELALRADAIFRVDSMTRPLTSVALLQLYEEGRLQLHDPVHRFIPEWERLEVFEAGSAGHWKTRPCERPLCVRDLLRQTCGLASGADPAHPVDAAFLEYGFRTTEGRTLGELVDVLGQLPLKFSPGTHWHDGVASDVCARLVELLTGQRFDTYLEDHLTGPLGMADTGFSVPERKRERLCASYTWASDGALTPLESATASPYLRAPSYFSGSRGLVSTSTDYLRFCRMLMRGGELDGARVLGRRTRDFLLRNHLPEGAELRSLALGRGADLPPGVGFGLGFALSLPEARSHSSGAGDDYYGSGASGTLFWNDPAEQLSVIFMTQLTPSDELPLRDELRSLVYSALIDPAP
jgi:CubicO group peptidase (beta-lactamase class C family)